MEIKTWYETEDTFDGGRVYISKDSGTTWNLLTPIGGYDSNLQATCDFDGGAFNGDDEDAWQTKKFNLSGYRGEDIRIKFNFCSNGSQTEEGWYIDDFEIKDVKACSMQREYNFAGNVNYQVRNKEN